VKCGLRGRKMKKAGEERGRKRGEKGEEMKLKNRG